MKVAARSRGGDGSSPQQFLQQKYETRRSDSARDLSIKKVRQAHNQGPSTDYDTEDSCEVRKLLREYLTKNLALYFFCIYYCIS